MVNLDWILSFFVLLVYRHADNGVSGFVSVHKSA
jgi:hypothetical protein